ncbi:MAG: hypothetical protein GX893_04045 [Firmicutes bacterium]|nr:hypothetical protein [Bacillota bacterium]
MPLTLSKRCQFKSNCIYYTMMITRFFNPLFQIISHMELAEAIITILANDGKKNIVEIFNDTSSGLNLIKILAEGTRAADIPFSGGYICTLWHFHHPWSHRGYLTKKSSANVTAELFAAAEKLWLEGNKEKAVFQLGRALHLLQDIFIPHHSGITAVKGHGDLEKWLTDNWKKYRVESGGFYHWSEKFCDADGNCHSVNSANPYDWIDYGSHLSFAWYREFFANSKYNEETFKKAAKLIIPNALKFSAGFVHLFFSQFYH